MSPSYQNILVTRTDRIGDVILSLPVAAAIKDAWPEATVTFLVSEAVDPVVRMCPWVDQTVTIDREHPDESTIRKLQSAQFDAAVCLYPRPQIAALLQRAKIPVRVGTSRRLYSFRFNRRVSVSRAKGGKHERDFNLDLLRGLGLDRPLVVDPLCIPPETSVNDAARLLSEHKVTPGDDRPIVIVHPGCGGSARNWSPENYHDLCRGLIGEGITVLLTGSSAERALAGQVAGKAHQRIINLAGMSDLATLVGLMRYADLFIGPSTGPMHVAAAVGCPVLALFGPVRTTTPDRWGPLGARHHVLTPGVPVCDCKLNECKLGDCMDRITVQSVGEVAVAMLQPRDSHTPESNERHDIRSR
ncbi:MAG: glycosyltransferase family 9 protein [Candidatus Zixiibacteriota bacterium]